MDDVGDQPDRADTLAVVNAFNRAFASHDLTALAGLVSARMVFEDTTPPDGRRHVGRDAVLESFAAFFASSPTARFTWEDVVVIGSRATVLWRYDWGSEGPDQGHVRGVDVLRVQHGQVVEKLSYVKG